MRRERGQTLQASLRSLMQYSPAQSVPSAQLVRSMGPAVDTREEELRASRLGQLGGDRKGTNGHETDRPRYSIAEIMDHLSFTWPRGLKG